MLGYFLKIKLRTILYIFVLFLFVLILINQFLSQNEDETIKYILWWTPFLNDTIERFISCKTSKCIVTENRKYLNKPETSVILFYGTSFDVHDLPLPRKSNQNWALIHEESPKNVALFLHEDSWNLFNFTSTFSRFSDFPITLQHLPNIEILLDKQYFIPVNEKNKLLTHLSPILYIQSDCATPLERDTYVNELMKYISVDSYGKCLNNKELPEKLKEDPLNHLYSEDFIRFVSQYKFVISFENSICDDYITEKLWRPLISGSVPIYLGSPTIKDWLPNNKSAILANEYKTPKDLVEYLMLLNNDDDLYNSYLVHKISGVIENQFLLNTIKERSSFDGLHFFEAFECFLCDDISSSKIKNVNSVYNCPDLISPVTKQTNMTNWWNDFWRDGKCQARLLKKYLDDKVMKITHDMFEKETKRLMNDELC